MNVSQLIQSRKGQIISVSPENSVLDALKLMAEKNIGALLVTENEKLVGIFSERDYARKIILKGKSSGDTKVKDVMTSHVLFAKPEQTIEECMALMSDKHIRHLPVQENDKLIGMISMRDLVNAAISEKDFIIKQLENYISGSG